MVHNLELRDVLNHLFFKSLQDLETVLVLQLQ